MAKRCPFMACLSSATVQHPLHHSVPFVTLSHLIMLLSRLLQRTVCLFVHFPGPALIVNTTT
jgi:hypothetical protein